MKRECTNLDSAAQSVDLSQNWRGLHVSNTPADEHINIDLSLTGKQCFIFVAHTRMWPCHIMAHNDLCYIIIPFGELVYACMDIVLLLLFHIT